MFTIASLKEQAGEVKLFGELDVEVQARSERETKGGKPYAVLTFADGTGSFEVNAWQDKVLYEASRDWRVGATLRLAGEWTQNSYGLALEMPEWRGLSEEEAALFYAGSGELVVKQKGDFATIEKLVESVGEPRLRALAGLFLENFGVAFRRAAAARKNHHARRGGLVEHVAQMMRAVDALCGVYGQVNRDLVLVGTLFHDAGKLWENQYKEQGMGQDYNLYGEMLGHITLGIELVNRLWRDMLEADEVREKSWRVLPVSSEMVRLHLLHLIASHHGELAYGSPVLPKTPEAQLLHYVDNLDAKLEMMKDAYGKKGKKLAEGIYERQFPLPANLVEPLPFLGL